MRILKPKERAVIDGKGETKKLIAKLDRVFSKFIRLRDTKDSDFVFGKCCTCRRLRDYAQLDCGHFFGRQYWGTRWAEDNCAAQCRFCNRFNEGRKELFAKYIGAKKIQMLEVNRKLRNRKPDAFILREKIKYYQEKIKELSP